MLSCSLFWSLPWIRLSLRYSYPPAMVIGPLGNSTTVPPALDCPLNDVSPVILDLLRSKRIVELLVRMDV